MKENGEGSLWNTSNEGSFPRLFNIELMLSCVMTRSQTLRYSMRGSRKVSDGLCESTQRTSYNAPLCLDCSASYGPILPRIPLHHPPYHQICSGATETGGLGPLHISYFRLNLVSSEKRAVWWPCGQIYRSCSGKHTYILLRMNIIHLCLAQRSTCMLTWTHMSQWMLALVSRLPQQSTARRLTEEV